VKATFKTPANKRRAGRFQSKRSLAAVCFVIARMAKSAVVI